MSTTFATSRRRPIPTPTRSRSFHSESATSASQSESTTPSSRSSLTVEFSLLESITSSSIPSASSTTPDSVPSASSSLGGAGATCATNQDCAWDTICSNGRCVDVNDASPIGGLGPEPTSRLSSESAAGVAFGLLAILALSTGLLVWWLRKRGRPEPSLDAGKGDSCRDTSKGPSWWLKIVSRSQPKAITEDCKPKVPAKNTSWWQNIRSRRPSPYTPKEFRPNVPAKTYPKSRTRSASNATDTRTLVASLPNSPQHGVHVAQVMPREFFAKALEYNDSVREKSVYRHSAASFDDSRMSMMTNKVLPAPPSPVNPLPPAPRYAINVNINKSICFDNESLLRAVSPLRDNTSIASSTPRERGPVYRFEEYLPPVAKTPPISIKHHSGSSNGTHEYELDRYPKNKRLPSPSPRSGEEESSDDELYAENPKPTKTKEHAKPPQLPLPDIGTNSPTSSFRRSYDWYADIISDKPRTPTIAEFSQLPSRSPMKLSAKANLIPEPLSPARPSFPRSVHLQSSSAAPPGSPGFRLAPTVYQPPTTKLPPMPPMPPQPPSPPPKPVPTRTSTFSTMTRQTHMSRSWLPDWMPEEQTVTINLGFGGPNDFGNHPSTYSPL